MKNVLIGSLVALATAGGSAAMAADMPLKAPPPPVFSWTGFYIGANIGGAWSHSSITDNVTGASLGFDNSGFIGGGQIGFNYQINRFVLGVEWDIDGTSINKTGPGVVTAFGTLQGSVNTDWVSTLTGRIGLGWDLSLIHI